MLLPERNMAIERDKIEEVLRQLPEELQSEVLEYAESLLQKSRARDVDSTENVASSVRSCFGIWDSGDPRSADNDRIDADLAREYAGSHEADA